MRILVTGGAGYLGSVVVRHLLAHRYRVRVVDSLRHGGLSLVDLMHDDHLEVRKGDLREKEIAEASLDGVDAIVHLAAIVGVEACDREPETAREINYGATVQLFDLAKSRGVGKFLFASTCSNYGRAAGDGGWPEDFYFTENSPLTPISWYAETKVDAELALLERTEPGQGKTAVGPGLTILRFSTLFGLSPRMRFDLTVNDFCWQLHATRKIALHGENYWRPYLHVYDAARAIVSILESPYPSEGRQIFNVGDNRLNYQKKQIVERVRDQIPQGVEIMSVENGDARDYRVSFDKLMHKLNFRARTSLDDGVREVLNVLRLGLIPDPNCPIYRN